MAPTIPEHVKKHSPWSISKAGVIEKCSLQYDFKYVQKMKELVQFEQSRVGTAVHRALEFGLRGVPQKEAFIHATDQFELSNDETETLQGFWESVEKFLKLMASFRQQHDVKDTFIEEQWAVGHDFSAVEFFNPNAFFRGVVDYGMLSGKNDLIVIDHKSGKERDLSYYATQFNAYAVLGLARRPDIRGIQTAVHFVQSGRLAWNKYVPASVIRNQLTPWLVDHLSRAAIPLLKPAEASKGWWCNWCGYKPTCPAHKEDNTAAENS